MAVRRICLKIAYDGTNYGGWQQQANAITVQQCIEENLRAVTGESIKVHASGRTDSGVHARGQIAHFDTNSRIPSEKFALVLNSGLPRDIRILSSQEVSSDFHARFNAKRKHYRYTINTAPVADALLRNFQLHVHAKLDVYAMQQAALFLVGVHDFSAFMATGTTIENTVREIYVSQITFADELLYYDVTGSGFLYNMVRIIVGTLLEIGKGKIAAEAMADIIAKKQRRYAGPTAPPQGLCLMEVEYDLP